MKKSVCLILMFFTFISLFSKPNEELLKTIRKATVYEDEIIGIGHWESKVYKAAQEYMSACSDKEIMELLNDQNNIVRCYAARFIKDRNIKADWYNILFSELENSEKSSGLAVWWKETLQFLREVWIEVRPKNGRVTWPTFASVRVSTRIVIISS